MQDKEKVSISTRKDKNSIILIIFKNGTHGKKTQDELWSYEQNPERT